MPHRLLAWPLVALSILVGCSTATTAPPGPVTRFRAIPRGGALHLAWRNPAPPFATVSVRRSTEDFPGTPTGGDGIYLGVANQFVDTDVTPGTEYFYSVFAQSSATAWALAAQARVVAQSPGSLDLAFNGTGIAADAPALWTSAGHDLAIDTEGRVVVAGQVGRAAETRQAVWRFGEDGQLDETFAGAGLVVFPQLTGDGDIPELDQDSARAVEIDPEGGILVAGSWFGTSSLARFLSDGRLDTTYGAPDAAGLVFLEDDFVIDLALDGTGRLMVLTSAATTGALRLRRFTQEGLPDGSFGLQGVVAAPVVDRFSIGNSLVVDSSGRTVVLGGGFEASFVMTLWRVLPDGTTDGSFGDMGLLSYTEPAGPSGSDVAVDAAGRIRVVGESTNNYDLTVWGYLAGSAPDPGWGTAGVQVHLSEDYERGDAVALDPAGRVIVGGRTFSLTHEATDIAFWRFEAGGAADPSFNGSGFAPVRDVLGVFGSSELEGMRLDGEERIVATGTADNRMFLVRVVP